MFPCLFGFPLPPSPCRSNSQERLNKGLSFLTSVYCRSLTPRVALTQPGCLSALPGRHIPPEAGFRGLWWRWCLERLHLLFQRDIYYHNKYTETYRYTYSNIQCSHQEGESVQIPISCCLVRYIENIMTTTWELCIAIAGKNADTFLVLV